MTAPIGEFNAPIYSVSGPPLNMLLVEADRNRPQYQRMLLVF
jgi:hypothetical protein